MPVSPEHEALHRIFQRDRGLFARNAQRAFGAPLATPLKVSELTIDLTETRPLERRADTVLLAEDEDGKYIVLVESQTEPDESRRKRWPYYVAYLQDKYDCPVVFVVVCRKAATAEWAREEIRVGRPGLICMLVRPYVLGPDNVPPVLDVREASANINQAMFAAITNSGSRNLRGILEVLAAALSTMETETAAELAEFTEAGLSDSAGLRIWRVLMATGTFPFVSQQRAEGRAEGRTADILRILKRRGIGVDQASRERIEGCTDLETLGTWLDRSLTADKVSELFAD